MKRISFAVAALALAGSAHAGPDLVVNGSFEQGLAGLGSFAGWTTILGDDTTFVDSGGQTGTHYGQASDGLWSAFFGSTMADGGATISQTLVTVAGQRYVVGFDLANDDGGLAAIDAFTASVDGAPLFSVAGLDAQDYAHESFAFFAVGPSTLLSFGGYNDNGYLELDDVVVTAVPEPATWALLGTGALVLTGLRLGSRRRR